MCTRIFANARSGGPRHETIVHAVDGCHPRRYDAVALPTTRHQRRVPLAAVRDAATAGYDAASRALLIRLDLGEAAEAGDLRELSLTLEVPVRLRLRPSATVTHPHSP